MSHDARHDLDPATVDRPSPLGGETETDSRTVSGRQSETVGDGHGQGGASLRQPLPTDDDGRPLPCPDCGRKPHHVVGCSWGTS